MNLFALFAVLLFITQASVPVPRQTSDRPATSSSQANTQSKGNNAPPAPSVAVVQPVTTPEGQYANRDHTKDNATHTVIVRELPTVTIAKGGFDWATLANCLLVVVGFGGIGVALWTLCFIRQQVGEMTLQRGVMQQTLLSIDKQATLMEKQTGILERSVAAAEVSAKAAQSSVDAMISKERARITVEIDSITFNPAAINFTVTCFGPTPAFVMTSWANARKSNSQNSSETGVNSPVELPSVFTESQPQRTAYIMNTAFALGKVVFTEAEIGDLDAGNLFIHFSGAIHYRDVFDVERETVFSYFYAGSELKNLDGTSFRYWRKGGPETNWAT